MEPTLAERGTLARLESKPFLMPLQHVSPGSLLYLTSPENAKRLAPPLNIRRALFAPSLKPSSALAPTQETLSQPRRCLRSLCTSRQSSDALTQAFRQLSGISFEPSATNS